MLNHSPTGWIGLSLGDVTGIGPEVTLKALAASPIGPGHSYLILGDLPFLEGLNARLGTKLTLRPFSGYREPGIFVHNPLNEPVPGGLAPGAVPAAKASIAWIREGARRCLAGELDALVTAPVNKHSIVASGERFIGQTELLTEMSGTDRTAMMLLGHDEKQRWLRVILATTHVPIRLVAEKLSEAKVLLAIELAAQACSDLGLSRARVAVCGLNPHAGEGGAIGDEEIRVVAPAVRHAQSKGLDVTGPLSADALFYYVLRGDYDAVVAMYHDQGLGPLKMIGFETGVNWTLGLPFIRTSPDHGTAYDIVGQGKANPSSMLSAMRLAEQLVKRRRSRH